MISTLTHLKGNFATTGQKNICLVFYTPQEEISSWLFPTGGCRTLRGLGAGALCKASNSPVPSFFPLGGRAGSHRPGFTMCWPAGAARQEIFPAGAAQGNVDISWLFITPGHTGGNRAWAKEWCVKGSRHRFQPEGIIKEAIFLTLWRLLEFFLVGFFFFPPQYICTDWEIKAAVNNVLAHKKVLEHPPSSCTASTWENY